MEYLDKFHMTKEQSIFLAKKKWDENVYCGMRMEHRAVTFPQTKTILEGVNVPSVSLDDIQAILNMRDAWRFMLATFDDPITFDYWCKLNEFIARNEALNWGHLRTGSVAISGTDYVPPVPDSEKVNKELVKLLAANMTATEKALMAFCWGTRGQFFWDGNKRTSLLLANKILLQAGAGMLTIKDAQMERFNKELLYFYDTGTAGSLMWFMYENSIQGIEFPEKDSVLGKLNRAKQEVAVGRTDAPSAGKSKDDPALAKGNADAAKAAKAIKNYEIDCSLSRPVTVINGDSKVLSQAAAKLQAAVDELNDIENTIFVEITGQEEKPSVLDNLHEKKQSIKYASDKEVMAASKRLIEKNLEDYKELAK